MKKKTKAKITTYCTPNGHKRNHKNSQNSSKNIT